MEEDKVNPEPQDEVKEELEQEEEVKEQEVQEEPKAEEEKPPKPKKSFDDRKKEIDRKTWEMHEERRRLEAERAEVEKQRQEVLQNQQQALKEPNIDEYDDTDKYKQDIADYYRKQSDYMAQQKMAERMQTAQAEKKLQDTLAQYNVRKQIELEKNTGYLADEQNVKRTFESFRTHWAVEQKLIELENSTEIVSYLAKNPNELAKVARSEPGNAIFELGRIGAKIESKPTKKITTAPPPPNDGAGRGDGGASTDYSRMSQAEFERRRNEEEAKSRGFN